MKESEFRAVALCQVLGSTTRYRILRLLARRRLRPSDLCRELGKSPNVISVHLAKLRAAGLVRFKRHRDGLYYWHKPKGLPGLMQRIERFVDSLSSNA